VVNKHAVVLLMTGGARIGTRDGRRGDWDNKDM
jgi:hypothetical protein